MLNPGGPSAGTSIARPGAGAARTAEARAKTVARAVIIAAEEVEDVEEAG